MKNLMKYSVFLLLTIFLNPLSFAEMKVTPEQLKSSLSQVSLSKDQIKMMVDVMVAQGQVTPQQGEKTKTEIDKLSEAQLQKVIQQAISHIQQNGTGSLKGMSLDDALKNLGK